MAKRKPTPKIPSPRGHIVRRRLRDDEIERRATRLRAFEAVDRAARPIPSLPKIAWPTRTDLLVDE
jgi:hypothetical protein